MTGEMLTDSTTGESHEVVEGMLYDNVTDKQIEHLRFELQDDAEIDKAMKHYDHLRNIYIEHH